MEGCTELGAWREVACNSSWLVALLTYYCSLWLFYCRFCCVIISGGCCCLFVFVAVVTVTNKLASLSSCICSLLFVCVLCVLPAVCVCCAVCGVRCLCLCRLSSSSSLTRLFLSHSRWPLPACVLRTPPPPFSQFQRPCPVCGFVMVHAALCLCCVCFV